MPVVHVFGLSRDFASPMALQELACALLPQAIEQVEGLGVRASQVSVSIPADMVERLVREVPIVVLMPGLFVRASRTIDVRQRLAADVLVTIREWCHSLGVLPASIEVYPISHFKEDGYAVWTRQ